MTISSTSSMSTSEIVDALARYRSVRPTTASTTATTTPSTTPASKSPPRRDPELVVQYGEALIERHWLQKSKTPDMWLTLEQVAQAAIECGRTDLAQVCVEQLSNRFPRSPRVDVLIGELLEGKGDYAEALSFYDRVLSEDPGNVAVRKRVISLHLHCSPIPSPSTSSSSKPSKKGQDVATMTGKTSTQLDPDHGLAMLVEYVDTYYNDVEAWSELSNEYAKRGLYAQSLQSLSHVILLAPNNPHFLLKHAETAYTMRSYELAYKEFLRVVEISSLPSSSSDRKIGGVGRRAAIGCKLCIARLKAGRSQRQGNNEDASVVVDKSKVNDVDLIVTQLVLDGYKEGPSPAACTSAIRKWIGGGGN